MARRGFVLVQVHMGLGCAGGFAGGVLPVVRYCVSWFVHVCRYLQCACSVVPTCVQASLVLLLIHFGVSVLSMYGDCVDCMLLVVCDG